MNQNNSRSPLYIANVSGIAINTLYIVSIYVMPFFALIIFALLMYVLAYVFLIVGIVSFFKLKEGPKYIPLLLVVTSVIAALTTMLLEQKMQNIPL